jgi:glycosyltransferase involved in cell wall biosynthesis
LIDSAPRVLAARPGARFAILGGEDAFFPGYEDELRGRVAAAGLAGSFAFVGHRPPGIDSADDAARFVSGCDLLAAPSVRQPRGGWREGFGLAAVEALQVGTPVVAYGSGALPEVLDGCARIVPEGDRIALGEAIATMLEDPELRTGMIERGRRRARERFSIDRAAEQMAAQYAEIARR